MVKKNTKSSEEAIVNASLSLAASKNWSYVSMSDIAKEAKTTLSELQSQFPSQLDILIAIGRSIDTKMLLEVSKPNYEEEERDRLFEVFMARFDALNENREAMISILNSFKSDPKALLTALPHLKESIKWVMEAAGLDTTRKTTPIKILILKGVYLNTLRSWMKDESTDMAKTMSTLDKSLNRMEQAEGFLGNLI